MNRKEQTEKFALDGIKLIVLIIAVLAVFVSFVSCTVEDDILLLEEPKLELNSSNNSIQTIHTIGGTLLNNGEEPYPQLVEWESSHNWTLNDTAYVIVRRTINVLGNWVTIDTSYVTGFNGSSVPTINEFSYSGDGGEINTVIAPIDEMVGDTLIVKARFEDIEKTIRIVLE